MRIIFVVFVLLNLGVFALGQGWFGTPRAEQGRSNNKGPVPINAEALRIAPGQLQNP
jgi:hypothetical protein